MTKARLALLASHEGSLMQAVIDACESGRLDAEVAIVISNNSNSGALARARAHGIAGKHMSRQTHGDSALLDRAMADILKNVKVSLVVLTGYMRLIGPEMLAAFRGRIINCHPALLPKYGGQGFYGRRVHEAVLRSRDAVTGSTIHYVDDVYDRGPIIKQNSVPVLAGDTAASLEARVKAGEHQLLIEALDALLNDIYL